MSLKSPESLDNTTKREPVPSVENREMRRIVAYALTLALPAVASVLFAGLTWKGTTELHTLMEVGGTTIALLVGVISLINYYTNKSSVFLFVGAGFVGTAFLDGYHAVVTSVWFDYLWPSAPPSLIPWSWNASRLFLSMLMLMSWWAWRYEDRRSGKQFMSERTVYLSVSALTLFTFAFFVLVPLPRAYYPEFPLGRPEELLAAAIFLVALWGYFVKGHWKSDVFEHSIVLSLTIGVVCQAMFMAFSFSLFDSMFDIAHILKIVSYICVLVGLLHNMHESFASAELNSGVLTRLNVELQEENANRRQIEKELRASEETTRSMVKTAVDGMMTIDEKGMVQSINPAAVEIFEYTEEEVIGNNINMLMPEPHHTQHDGYLSKYMKTGIAGIIGQGQRQLMGRRKSGVEFPLELGVSEFQAGERHDGARIFTGILRDISGRKKAQEALTSEKQKLEEANGELRRSNEALDDFAYIASHNLRESLQDLQDSATFLRDNYADKLDEEGRSKLDGHTFLTGQMEERIDTLFEFSRVGRLDFAVSETDLNETVKEVVEQLHSSLVEKHIEIRIPRALPSVIGDSARIAEVFRNLIGNAIQYNDSSKKWIELGWKEGDAEDSRLDFAGAANQGAPVFYVRDNGIGIEETHLVSIFRIFKRLHDRDEVDGGQGTGLAFAKKIVEKHGGRMWVESNFGEGSTFFFTLQGKSADDSRHREQHAKFGLDLTVRI